MRLGILKTPDQRAKRQGFTIVELLVVIVIIGILAATTIIAYNGIVNRAHAASLQSDLSNSAKMLGVDHAGSGTYPATAAQAGDGQGLRVSPGNSFSYNVSADGSLYCLQETNGGQSYFVNNNNTVPQEGACDFVSTLAGSGTRGYIDGTGTAAKFNLPYGITVDSAGNLYVADNFNNRIRKVTPAGAVTTFAGDGTAGYVNGTGTAAKFNHPSGIAVDSSGNVYVGDSSNNRIRKITSTGVVTTLAGDGTAGYVNGTGTMAEFNSPYGVTIDSVGNVYVADVLNNRIRKITSAGIVTTLAGTGTASYIDDTGEAAGFNNPNGIAVDSAGNIYVGDTYNNVIRKITSAGVVTTLAGNGARGSADGTGAAARFIQPFGVAVDASGNVYVADVLNNVIRRITSAGVVTTLAGNSTSGTTDGTGTAANFYRPQGIAVGSTGTIYVADTNNSIIRVIK